MKSKRLLSLALAVALSLSALGVYATGSGDAGVTVSAKSISYNTETDVKFPDLVATVNFEATDIEKLWKDSHKIQMRYQKKDTDEYMWLYESDIPGNKKNLANPDTPVGDPDHGGYNCRMLLSNFGLDDKKLDRSAYKTYGWMSGTSEDDVKEQGKVSSDKEGERKALTSNSWVYFDVSSMPSGVTVYFSPVFKELTDEEIVDAMAAKAEAEAVSKVKSSWTDHAYRAAYRNSAGNNVRNKSSGGIATMFAEAKIQTGEIDTDKNLVYNKEQIASIKKAVGAEDDEIVFVYNVRVPKDYELITGKKMGVRLQLPSGYTTKGYIPTVFHAPITGVQKVENFETGAYEVMFFARDFSPYVLILSPGKVDKYENPPTGDASAVPVALLAAASLSATGTVLLRRKRELGE